MSKVPALNTCKFNSKEFNVFDLNCDGKIDFRELIKGLKLLELEEDQTKIKTLFAKLDTNGDGFIDPKEFLNLQTNV